MCCRKRLYSQTLSSTCASYGSCMLLQMQHLCTSSSWSFWHMCRCSQHLLILNPGNASQCSPISEVSCNLESSISRSHSAEASAAALLPASDFSHNGRPYPELYLRTVGFLCLFACQAEALMQPLAHAAEQADVSNTCPANWRAGQVQVLYMGHLLSVIKLMNKKWLRIPACLLAGGLMQHVTHAAEHST